jgi:ATP-binding cassette subfamily B (MDR/TAP) protein 1
MIMEMIREWRRNKTTIIITHDASQILDDDFVYVIEDSRIVEEGLKHNLLEHENSYLAAIVSNAKGTPPPAVSEATSTPDSPLISTSFGNSELWTNRESQLLPDWSMRLSVSNGLRLASLIAPLPIDQSEAPSRDTREHLSRIMVPKQSPHLQLDIEDDIEYEKRRFSEFVRDKFSLTDLEVSQHTRLSNTGSSSIPQAIDIWELRSESETLVDGISYPGANVASKDDNRCHSQDYQQPSQLPNIRRSSKLSKTQRVDKGSLGLTIKTIWPSLSIPNRVALILGLFICLVGAATTPAFAYCFARLLSVFWSYGDKDAEGRKWAITLVGIAIIDGIATGASRYLIEMAAQAWVDTIRVKALEKIFKQSKTWFDESEHSPGRINECLDRNSEETRNIVGRFIPIVVHVTAILTISVIWALVVSWKLTLVSLAPIPIILAAIKGYSYVSGIWERQCNKSAEDASAVLTEIFSNIRVVKSLALETHFCNKYSNSVSDTLGVGFKRALYPSGLYGLYQSTNYAVVALVFYYGTALMVKDMRITASGMMQVVNLLLFGIGTSSSILSHIPQLTMAQAAATALLRLANLPSSPPTEYLGHHRLSCPLPLRLNKISFSYPSDPRKLVLRDVSFVVSAGQCVAIVGHSGCGKSTIISLLLGLYPPNRSLGGGPSLSFSGLPYTDIDIAVLRSMMAYVPQTPFLFPGTITDNIAYGLSDNSPYRNAEEIRRAAQNAGVHDFIISLPDGYNTLVGEGGQAISGGQAQRVNIACALLRQPKLLILDEPTSALDPQSAEMVRGTLLELTHQSKNEQSDMAIVLVTHNREMMQIADEVVVLEDGRSVEIGSYSELLHADGPLAELLGIRRPQGEKGRTRVNEQDISEGGFF